MAIPKTKLQIALLNVIKKAKGEPVNITSLSWNNVDFFHVSSSVIYAAAKVLAEKGLIRFNSRFHNGDEFVSLQS